MLKKRAAAADGGRQSQASYDAGQWAKAFPTLVEFLTQATWEDGSSRECGTVTLMAEDGVWKASIRDRAQGVYCYLSGRTPGDLLAAVERGLKDDSLDWRLDKPWEGKGRKK